MQLCQIAILWLFAAMGACAFSQDASGVPDAEEGVAPVRKPKPKGAVQITFTPPPMEGVITMGVFDASTKLVRVLHSAATEKDFTVGLNGFITKWDGADDAGAPAPAGKYHVRGWAVGKLKPEGVAFHCNDWAKDDGPRYVRVKGVQPVGRDAVGITVRDAMGEDVEVGWELKKEGLPDPAAPPVFNVMEGKLTIGEKPLELGDGARAVAATAGFAGSVWVIVELPSGREVRAYSKEGEFLRRLAYAEGEPEPKQIAGSQWSETVFLLDENAKEQRVRALSLTEKDGGPAWKTVYQKRIVWSETFDAVAAELGRPEPVKALPMVRVTSKPNPLLQNARTPVELVARIDAKGALLATSDGLPLLHVSEVPGLKWAVLASEGKSMRMFTGDGAVVEEFEIKRPDNLMEFDAGTYELRR